MWNRDFDSRYSFLSFTHQMRITYFTREFATYYGKYSPSCIQNDSMIVRGSRAMLNNLWASFIKPNRMSVKDVRTRLLYAVARVCSLSKFVYTFKFLFIIICKRSWTIPDRRHFQYVPFDRHVKLREIHSDVNNVRTDFLVHVSQVYLQNDTYAFFLMVL